MALGHPLYVVEKEPKTNTIVVGERETLMTHEVRATETNWFVDPPTDWTPCSVKIRYNAEPEPARVRVAGDGMEVVFDEPQFAVAPGQAVVCYDGERVLGGGWIVPG